MIAAAFLFHFMAVALDVINRCGPSNEMPHQLHVLAILHYYQDEALQF